MQKVFNGNNIDLLKDYPDNYFDAVVTDPPYGLGKEPNAEALMKDWIEHGYHEILGSGFMGKEWDAFVPQPVFWKEVYRVLKHGGHVLSFFGTRTYDWGVMSMRFAGFEVRDCIQWLYGSGFPKSHNIGKAVDKLQGNIREVIGEQSLGYKDENHSPLKVENGWNNNSLKNTFDLTKGQSQWEGWGTALKPANEPIVLARKPLEKGLSIAENILKWGVGGINIDASRIGLPKDDPQVKLREGKTIHAKGVNEVYSNGVGKIEGDYFNAQGRFPANIILTHHEDCECNGTKKVKGSGGGQANHIGKDINNTILGKGYKRGDGLPFGDENGKEEVEDWDCHEDCPIRILDEQSGVLKSGDIKPHKEKGTGTIYGNGSGFFSSTDYREVNFKGDKGGASRFFYVAKASKAERNKGLEDFDEKPLAFSNQAKAELKRGNAEFDGGQAKGHGNSIRHLKNFHPTVKPIKLMQYLVKMITPPNGIVLDPFCGSGTTGVACKLDEFQFVGLEQDAEYAKIAEARIENYIKEKQIKLF
jgi:site-specific DNA-methyltransferase (adenine-specific)